MDSVVSVARSVLEALTVPGVERRPARYFDDLAERFDPYGDERYVDIAVPFLTEIADEHDPAERAVLVSGAVHEVWQIIVANGGLTIEEELEDAAAYDAFLRELGEEPQDETIEDVLRKGPI
jgi:hypothetical protein